MHSRTELEESAGSSAGSPETAAGPAPGTGAAACPPSGARAWIVWAAAVAVYFVAVFNRSSLGVAGLDAERRFGIDAAALSSFSMLQMLVYAAMQIPVGLLIDRFGPRRTLLTGLAVMCVAQTCFAAVASFGLALAARGLLGCGDAMVFISVLRLVNAWFPGRRVPLLTQLTSLAGAAGGIASTWPLAWALRTLGWSGTFLAIAALGACVLTLPVSVVRDAPRPERRPQQRLVRSPARLPGRLPVQRSAGRPGRPAGRRADLAAQMRAGWSSPRTRLGLWIHFTTGFPAMVFSLLWGYPFLVQGEGLGAGAAGSLLTLLVCVNMAFSFGFGILLTRRPGGRVGLALAVVAVTALALGAVLAWPGRAPLWLLVVLTCAYASNGAGSMIGFDVARRDCPPERLGTASGMVNVGAFLACAITLPATGFLVDRTGAGHAPSAAAALHGYKIAFCFPYVLLALGAGQILRLSRLAGLTPRVDQAPVPASDATTSAAAPVGTSVGLPGSLLIPAPAQPAADAGVPGPLA